MTLNYRRYEASSIKSRIDSYDFYLKEQTLNRFKNKSCEWAEAGLCPFHDDHATGSFRVNLESGAYRCFSCDAKGRDIIAFTMAKYSLSFYEALKQLANEWGVY